MNLNTDLEPLVAYQVGPYYSFELPEEDEAVQLVQVRLAPGAWLEGTPLRELVICTRDYAFGAPLMQALDRGMGQVEELSIFG